VSFHELSNSDLTAIHRPSGGCQNSSPGWTIAPNGKQPPVRGHGAAGSHIPAVLLRGRRATVSSHPAISFKHARSRRRTMRCNCLADKPISAFHPNGEYRSRSRASRPTAVPRPDRFSVLRTHRDLFRPTRGAFQKTNTIRSLEITATNSAARPGAKAVATSSAANASSPAAKA
jgi:hypothetical protein